MEVCCVCHMMAGVDLLVLHMLGMRWVEGSQFAVHIAVTCYVISCGEVLSYQF